jgi:hypothetical protein
MVPMLSTVSVFFVVYDTPHVLQPSQCAESEPLLTECFRAQLQVGIEGPKGGVIHQVYSSQVCPQKTCVGL